MATKIKANWPKETIEAVWEKAHIVSDFDHAIWRKDEWGAWISREQYGDRGSRFGWEIVRISATGRDDLFNLRPVHWENVIESNNDALVCCFPADGGHDTGLE